MTLPAPETTEIQTSSQAAEALKPIAGPFAFAIFVMGVVGMNKLHRIRSSGRRLRWPDPLSPPIYPSCKRPSSSLF